jgi:hypothetical protein
MPTALPDLYTIDELIERYPHLSRDTVYDLLQRRELRGFKIGRVWHIDPDDWAAFIDRRKRALQDDDGATDAPVAPSPRRRRRTAS